MIVDAKPITLSTRVLLSCRLPIEGQGCTSEFYSDQCQIILFKIQMVLKEICSPKA